MPNVCGPFTLIEAPAACGIWSVGSATGPDGTRARLSQLDLKGMASSMDVSGAERAFQRIVDATAGCQAPPTVLALLAGGVQDDVLWLAEEEPKGPSLLDNVTQSGPLKADQVPSLIHSLAAALEPLAGAGLHHGWLCPRNIFPEGNSVRLGGWVWPAVMARLAAAGGLEWPDEAYVAPEMRAGAAPTRAAEVYSAAVLAVFASTGSSDVAQAVLGALPPALAQAVATGLSQEPEARYRTVKEMIVDVTVEQAIAMTDQAETVDVPTGGDVPDWAEDLLAETLARREAGEPDIAVEPEPEPAAATQAPPAAHDRTVADTTVRVEPSAPPSRPHQPGTPPGPVFEWNVGEQEKRSVMPMVFGFLSALFVILGIALTLIRHH